MPIFAALSKTIMIISHIEKGSSFKYLTNYLLFQLWSPKYNKYVSQLDVNGQTCTNFVTLSWYVRTSLILDLLDFV